jgi:uncharacterized ferredoxin-like protein
MESEYIARKTKLIEYTKIHIISLEQDLENIAQEMEELDPESKACKELDFEYNHMSGQILSARYLLKTMEEML